MATFLTPLLSSVKLRITEKYTPHIKRKVKKHILLTIGSAVFMAVYLCILQYINKSDLNILLKILLSLPYLAVGFSLLANIMLSVEYGKCYFGFKHNLMGYLGHTIEDIGKQDIKLTQEENKQLFMLPFEQTHLDYLINAVQNQGYISHDDLQYIEDTLQGFSELKKNTHDAHKNTIQFMKDNNISVHTVDNIDSYTLLQNILSNKKVINGKVDVKKIL